MDNLVFGSIKETVLGFMIFFRLNGAGAKEASGLRLFCFV